MPENNRTIYFFLLLSLLVHLGLFYHYRSWSPAVNLDKITRPGKEQIPVSIIELPPEKKTPKKKEVKPIKPRFLAEKNRRAEHETRLKKQLPDSGPDRISRPATPPAAPKKPSTARPKSTPKAQKQAAKEPRQKAAEKQQPMGKMPIKRSKALQKARDMVSKKNKAKKARETGKTAKKLFPSYDELTRISRENSRRQRATKLPDDLDPGTSVQLNTKLFEFQSYYINLKRKIELVWEYPYLARESGLEGRLRMRFVINRDGSLAEARILRSSGSPLLDQEALRAVHDASPFPPLPPRMHTERLVVNATFEYLLDYKTIH